MTHPASPPLPRHATAHAVRLLAAAVAMCGALALHAAEPATVETTLAVDTAVPVDLRQSQHDADQAAVRRLAEIEAKIPGAAQRKALLPEFILVHRHALADLPITTARPEGATQVWFLRSKARPDLFAERVIIRLARAGFTTITPCAGEEWSGTHGGNRVALIVEKSGVKLVLQAGASCPR